MKRNSILTTLALLLLLLSCGAESERMRARLEQALALAADNPDSAMAILNTIRADKLSGENLAVYSLAHTWALDRQGTDVSDDSLLRHAFNHFSALPDSPHHPRTMYYMGKYYSLIDSTEQSIACYEASIESAKRHEDAKTQCLAMEKLSKIILIGDGERAEQLADSAVNLCAAQPEPDTVNLVYFMLNKGDCEARNSKLQESHQTIAKAMTLAYAANDSTLISGSHQDMSIVCYMMDSLNSSLIHAKTAYNYRKTIDNTIAISLAHAYLALDSLQQAKSLLENLDETKALDKYSKEYYLMTIAINEGDKTAALQHAQVAYNSVENMYIDELKAKDRHYATVLQQEKDNQALALKSLQKTVAIIVGIFLAIAIAIIIYYLWQAERRATARKEKIAQERAHLKQLHQHALHEQEKAHQQALHEQEKTHMHALHQKELKHKETQLKTMRDFLARKIEVVDRLKDYMPEKDKQIKLSEREWKEIELFLENIDLQFVSRFKAAYPKLKQEDLRLCMLLRIGIPSKILAMLYNISERSIKQKLFLRKEYFGLNNDSISLRTFIENF